MSVVPERGAQALESRSYVNTPVGINFVLAGYGYTQGDVAVDATYYTGGRTTIDGEKGAEQENVRLGMTAARSSSRHQSIKVYGSTGAYNRTGTNFWAVGIAWQYRWGGGL